MAKISELLGRAPNTAVECLDLLYLNGYIRNLASGPVPMIFLRG